MRVTNKMLSNNFLSDMNTNLQNLQTLQKQMTTGKLFSKPSDDPFSVARAMQLHTSINTNTMYNDNIKDTINWLDTTDTALGQVNDVLQRVRELLVSSGNGAYSPTEREKIKDEVNQKVSQISQILNTSFDGKYIFGGTKGTTKPTNSVEQFVPSLSNVTVGNASEISVSGVSTNTQNTNYSVTISGGTITLTKDGSAVSPAPVITSDVPSGNKATFDGMTIHVATTGNYTFEINTKSNNNSQLVYANKDGSILDPNGTTDEQNQFKMIGTDLQTEVSQGVTMQYNVGADKILKYGAGSDDDLRVLLQKIANHLDGNNDNGSASDSTATSQLTGQDLTDLDTAISNILTVRSQVGAKQNRMDSAQTQNTDMSTNLTEILSKTEDIDITQKTMEYATAQTVYLASLQTSAKVIQPTLMDYLT